jgi:purine-nucleoside phosphorylase
LQSLFRLAPLRPTAPIAADALLPGDPARALQLAQVLLTEPKMSNHAHGLWGYGGRTEEGRELTIQSIGIGAPSGAIVLAELSALGVRRAVQVGTCRAIVPDLRLGDLLVVREAIGADGVSRELGGEAILAPDPELGAALTAVGGAEGVRSASVASTDLLGELDGRPAQEWARRGAEALEMAAAALFAAGPRCGVAVASLLAITEADGEAIEDEQFEEASARMGRLAMAALSTSG